MSSNKKLLQGASGFINQSGGLNVEDVFSCDIAVGVPGGSVTINNGIDLSSEGGLVWTKNREITSIHYLVDTVRGAGKGLYSNTNDAEANVTDGPTSFSSNGFSTGSSPANSHIYWTFRKAENFFDIVTYTGSGENGQTISHNLGSVPGMVIVKDTDASSSWYVYHRSLGSGKHLKLNENNEESSDTNYEIGKDTATATQFSIDTGSEVDANGNTYVAYFFAHHNSSGTFGSGGDQDIIKCDTFTTDSSGNYDGSSALGFEPQWLMVKNVTSSGNWFMHDSLRGISDITINYLQANQSNAEITSSGEKLKLTSQGFVYTSNFLQANKTYIYMAIRKGRMQTPTSSSNVFGINAFTTTSSTSTIYDLGIKHDMVIGSGRAGSGVTTVDKRIQSRLTGMGKVGGNAQQLLTNSNSSENGRSDFVQAGSSNNSVQLDGAMFADTYLTTGIFWAWSIAKGYFDVVAYTGNGSAGRQITHNLGATPEMIWVKLRDTYTDNWIVYHSGLTTNYNIVGLDTNMAEGAFARVYSPSSTIFTVSSDTSVNSNSLKYIAYLFASGTGVSKLGSFSHSNGSSTDVDCGFSSGSKFVLVKRKDSTGDWYVWDTTRGIVSGNDPYTLLNSDAAEVTNTDYIDTLSSGFQMASGFTTGDYIFYAIAT
jgi:hypothetical protein